MKLIFAIISSLFILIGFVPYIRDIHLRKTKPQFFSWIGWGILTIIGGIATISDIPTWGSMILFTNSFVCFVAAFYSLVRGVAIFKTSRFDYIFILTGFLGLVLWGITGNPDLAIIFAIVADFSFGILTLIKTYKDPGSETKLSWLMAVFSGIAGILAISYISFTEVAYPMYLFVYDFLMFLIVYRIIKATQKITPKKIIIFDNDGVFTPETVHFHQRKLNEFGCDITWAEHYEILKGNWHENESRSSVAALQNVDWNGYIDFIVPEYSVIDISKDVVEIVKYLASKYILIIVSSGSDRAMNPYLRHNNIENYFSDVMGKESGLSKSEKMRSILEKYNVKPEQCVCITDTLGDILEAREVSIDSIALTWGAHTKKDLKKGKPIRILETFMDLKKMFK